MDKYTELYAWIWKAFRREEFSIDQFRLTFPISQAPKVAHDLVKKGYLERTGRGMYKAVEPEEFIQGIAENQTDYAFLEEAAKDYAFCESTAESQYGPMDTTGQVSPIYVLHPKDRLKSVRRNGLKVIPLEDTVGFCLLDARLKS